MINKLSVFNTSWIHGINIYWIFCTLNSHQPSCCWHIGSRFSLNALFFNIWAVWDVFFVFGFQKTSWLISWLLCHFCWKHKNSTMILSQEKLEWWPLWVERGGEVSVPVCCDEERVEPKGQTLCSYRRQWSKNWSPKEQDHKCKLLRDSVRNSVIWEWHGVESTLRGTNWG